jgi:hypothetical protein
VVKSWISPAIGWNGTGPIFVQGIRFGERNIFNAFFCNRIKNSAPTIQAFGSMRTDPFRPVHPSAKTRKNRQLDLEIAALGTSVFSSSLLAHLAISFRAGAREMMFNPEREPLAPRHPGCAGKRRP